jgi:hypothetical protein
MKRSLGDGFVDHLHTKSIQKHQRVICVWLLTLPLLVLAQKEHQRFCRAESLLSEMVVSPVDRFVSLQFDKIVVPSCLEFGYYAVSLEPRTIQHNNVGDVCFDFLHGFAVFMRIKDESIF